MSSTPKVQNYDAVSVAQQQSSLKVFKLDII